MQCHIGVPKFIQKGFAIKEQVYCYNYSIKKVFQTSIKRLGTENNYYDDYVEKELLSEGIEAEFAKLYKDFCSTNDIFLMNLIIKNNTALIIKFFSIMYARAKKILNMYNKTSNYSEKNGDMSHSQFLEAIFNSDLNPLDMIGEQYDFFPLINFSDSNFINNSVGFGVVQHNQHISFIIPFDVKRAILISGDDYSNQYHLVKINKQDIETVKEVNQWICFIEKKFGNGFIFGQKKEDILDFINFF